MTAKPGYCPKIWDGIMCWAPTPPNFLRMYPCPDYFAGFVKDGTATKKCMEDGSWYVGEDNGTWTNFSLCMKGDQGQIITYFNITNENITHMEDHLNSIKTISIIGYSVSLIILLVALVILFSFKRLRCPRNTLHAHLFLSFMMRAGISLLKHSLMYQGVGLSNELINLDGELWITDTEVSWTCKLLSTLWQYFILANYSWLLMEGLYLHNLIFLALFSDTSAITSYIVLGWCGPLAVIIPWLIVRLTMDDEFCWTTHTNSRISYFIIEIPIILSILVNFFLFLNIVRVLHLKLTASISEEQRRFRYRRWAKSTLVLVPLFGVHYVFFVWYLPIERKRDWLELVWLLIDQIFSSSQGSVVAILYCFLNGEVRAEIVKKWRKIRENRRRPGYRINNYRPSRLFNQRKMSTRQCNNSTVVDSSMFSFMSSGPSERRLTHTQITEITTQNEVPPPTSKLV